MTRDTWWLERSQRRRHAAGALTFDRYTRLARALHVPEGESGSWRISRWVPDEHAARFARLRAAISGSAHGRGGIPAGRTITYLHRGTTLVMSDTPDELRDSWPFVQRAHGTVLVNGLGLGCVVRALLAKADVQHVTVVELSGHVLQLVGPSLAHHVAAGRLVLHQGDALAVAWPKGTRWTCAWHDIWDNITADNRPTMATLNRRYGQRVEFQEAWVQDLVRGL